MVRALLTACVLLVAASSSALAAPKKILFVNDNLSLQAQMKDYFTKAGYAVETAGTGEEGIEKAKFGMPNIILMDIVMPGIGGFKATRAITQDPVTKGIPVIILSSKNQETDKIQAQRQGAKGYLAIDGNAVDWPGVAETVKEYIQ